VRVERPGVGELVVGPKDDDARARRQVQGRTGYIDSAGTRTEAIELTEDLGEGAEVGGVCAARSAFIPKGVPFISAHRPMSRVRSRYGHCCTY
jgi:hypothetical protein